MSSENMTTIDRIYGAFETRDFFTFFSLLSPTIHITQCPEIPWGGVFHGVEEAKLFFGKVTAYLEDHVTIKRIIDGSDIVKQCAGRGAHDQAHLKQQRLLVKNKSRTLCASFSVLITDPSNSANGRVNKI